MDSKRNRAQTSYDHYHPDSINVIMNETIRDKLKFCFHQQKLLQRKFYGKKRRDLTIDNSTLATTLYREEPSSKRQQQTKRLFMLSTPKDIRMKQSINQDAFDILINIQITDCNLSQTIAKIISIAVDINDLTLFTLSIHCFARIFYIFNDYNKSIFLFNQLRIITIKTNNTSFKLKSLIGLGDCSIRVKNSEAAINFYKRALQYCWMMREVLEEAHIYEKLALAYYYQGDVKKAYIFHLRVCRGETEDDTSPIKMISQENINDYARHINKIFFTSINTLLLLNISLPMLTVEEFNFQASQTRKEYEFTKNRYFQNAKAHQIIESLMQNDYEFHQQIPTPRFSTVKNNIFIKTRKQVQKKLVMKTKEWKQLYTKFSPQEQQNKIYDQGLYKYPLDKLLDIRLNQKLNPGVRKVRQQSEINSPINLNHWIKEDNEQQSRIRMIKIKEQINQIYDDMVQSWIKNVEKQ